MCKTLGSGDNDSQFMEYVVFDPAQALPLCLVEYTANIAWEKQWMMEAWTVYGPLF